MQCHQLGYKILHDSILILFFFPWFINDAMAAKLGTNFCFQLAACAVHAARSDLIGGVWVLTLFLQYILAVFRLTAASNMLQGRRTSDVSSERR